MITDREKYVNLEDVKITLHNTDSLGKAAWEVISLPYIVPPKWIPVTEQLPEERIYVLLNAPKYKNIYMGYIDNGKWFLLNGCSSYNDLVYGKIDAWMPLPELYEEVDE